MSILLLLLACAPEPPPVAPAPASRAAPRAQATTDAVMIKPAERDPKWSGAVCNDGTPFGLTLRQGTSDTWVIKVAGGYFCDDIVTPCEGRQQRLITTPTRKDGPIADKGDVVLRGDGLFSTSADDNPVFHDANHVELHYCSSDLWVGSSPDRQATTGAPEGWFFAGRANIRAALEVLAEQHGLDDGKLDTKVLLVGSSAGGMGVIGNLPTWIDKLPQTRARGGLKVLLDGAWVPPQPTLDDTPKANRWGSLLPACEAEKTKQKRDPLECVFGPSWYPHFATAGVPVLIQQSAQDLTQLKVYGVKDEASARAWRDNARSSFEGVSWLYSGGFPYHIVAFDPKFTQGAPGQTFRDVVTAFWTDGEPQRVLFRYEEKKP